MAETPSERVLDYQAPVVVASLSEMHWQAPPRTLRVAFVHTAIRVMQILAFLAAGAVCARLGLAGNDGFAALGWGSLLSAMYCGAALVFFWIRIDITVGFQVDGFGIHVVRSDGRRTHFAWPDIIDINVRRPLFGLIPYSDLRVRLHIHGDQETLLRVYDSAVVTEARDFLNAHWKANHP